MDNIIIIRVADPDGSVFQRVKDALEDHAKDVIDIDAPYDANLSWIDNSGRSRNCIA